MNIYTLNFRAIKDVSVVSLPSGWIATLGGFDMRKLESLKEIWLLDEVKWKKMKSLLQVREFLVFMNNSFSSQDNHFSSAISKDNTIYLFPGESRLDPTRQIQRIQLGKIDQILKHLSQCAGFL